MEENKCIMTQCHYFRLGLLQVKKKRKKEIVGEKRHFIYVDFIPRMILKCTSFQTYLYHIVYTVHETSFHQWKTEIEREIRAFSTL